MFISYATCWKHRPRPIHIFAAETNEINLLRDSRHSTDRTAPSSGTSEATWTRAGGGCAKCGTPRSPIVDRSIDAHLFGRLISGAEDDVRTVLGCAHGRWTRWGDYGPRDAGTRHFCLLRDTRLTKRILDKWNRSFRSVFRCRLERCRCRRKLGSGWWKRRITTTTTTIMYFFIIYICMYCGRKIANIENYHIKFRYL